MFISPELFDELEHLARLVDVTYCVGTPAPGVWEPFECPSRCGDFRDIELVKVSFCASLLGSPVYYQWGLTPIDIQYRHISLRLVRLHCSCSSPD